MIAVVLDGGLKSALAAVRSLGKRGVPVVVGGERKTAMASHSRYVASAFVYTSPLKNQDAFISEMREQLQELSEPPLLYAFSDATYLTLARNVASWQGSAYLPLPPQSSIECAFSKRKTWMLSQSLGISVPQTYNVASLQELRALAPSLRYPVVVKPEHSASWRDGRGNSGRVIFALNTEDLLARIERIYLETREMPLVQKFVQGEEYGVEALVNQGEICALAAHRRIRSLSPLGGASVVKETIEIPALMRLATEKLLRALKWHGVAMVEFKMDIEHNELLFIEINGRFWGSLPLAIHAGVDFPYLYASLVSGKVPQDLVCARPGVVSRHLLGDMKHLWSVLFKRDSLRALAYPSRWKALCDFIFTSPCARADVFDVCDPLPSVMEVIDHALR